MTDKDTYHVAIVVGRGADDRADYGAVLYSTIRSIANQCSDR